LICSTEHARFSPVPGCHANGDGDGPAHRRQRRRCLLIVTGAAAHERGPEALRADGDKIADMAFYISHRIHPARHDSDAMGPVGMQVPTMFSVSANTPVGRHGRRHSSLAGIRW
jgi:hypothetical protein